MTTKQIKQRLKYLRGEIQAERISTGEILELESLADYIESGDVELLQWANVPEFTERRCSTCRNPLPTNERGATEGYYCHDEYYCSEDCVNLSLPDGETFEEHYEAMGGDNGGECYFTEWEVE